MATKLQIVSILVGCLLATVPTQAGLTGIDQEQLVGTSNMTNFSNVGLAQSFKPSVSQIAGAAILVQSDDPVNAELTIALYDAIPDPYEPAKGSALTKGSLTITNGDFTTDTWLEVPFDVLLAVTPEDTYFLDFSTDQQSGLTGFYIRGSTSDVYNRGIAYVPFLMPAGLEPYVPFGTHDYAFRTYSEVPAPSALLLGAWGIVFLRGLHRRNQSTGHL